MGAKIEGAGTRRIIIEGVKELHGAEHEVIPTASRPGTFLVAGAICGNGVTLRNVIPEHLECISERLMRGGFPLRDTTAEDRHRSGPTAARNRSN